MNLRGVVAGIAIAGVTLVAAGCSSGSTPPAPPSTTPPPTTHVTYAVGEATMTFVDSSRPTAAHGPSPELPQRTLPTTIFYPATGAASPGKVTVGATPVKGASPHPLIVFSHGFGANPDVYKPLLTHWAAAGYVVAAPLFPLSSSKTPGGPSAGDVKNQPGDVSFVVTSMLDASAAKSGTFAGLIDPDEVGAAGHSNGAITTLGLTANTCCQDKRIKAAEVLAGTEEPFPDGKFDYAEAPPLLFVHGTADALVPYSAGVKAFNEAEGPKGLVTITDGNHGAAAAMVPASADSVLQVTTDFFDRYLRGDTAAAKRVAADGKKGVTIVRFTAAPGSTMTVPTLPAPKLDLHATATPTTGLQNGQQVTVNWSGYSAGKAVSILQCTPSNRDMSNSAGCDFSHAALLQPNPTGSGSAEIKIVEGKVGDGICDADHPGCFILVNNASSTDPASSVFIPIGFAS